MNHIPFPVAASWLQYKFFYEIVVLPFKLVKWLQNSLNSFASFHNYRDIAHWSDSLLY